MSRKSKTTRAVQLTEAELFVISDALAAYQKAMEQAVYLSYTCITSRQRNAMMDKSIEAIELRSRLHKSWEGADQAQEKP